jgi:ATP-dependent helicase HrpB
MSAASTAISGWRSRSTCRRRCGPICGCWRCRRRWTGERFSALLGGAPLIESEGRSYPIELSPSRPLGRADRGRHGAAIRRALGETNGGVLAFLPGVAEIERTAERLARLPADVVLHRLYGTLDPATQRAAIRAEAPGGASS